MEVPGKAGSGPADPDDFNATAAAAGLVLPSRRRVDPWLAVGVAVLIILASVGIGYATGWLDPAPPRPGYSHPANCVSPVVNLRGSVDALATPLLSGSFANLTANYTRSSGGCIAFELDGTTGDGALTSLAQRSSDFVLLSAPPTPAQSALLPSPIYLFPVLVGSVSVIYNLPGIPGALDLTPADLAGIYLGTVPAWNASALASANPSLARSGLPPLLPVHAAGPSGVTAVFTGYLSTENASWAVAVGSGPSVAWPAGGVATGSGGVLAEVAATPGAIGFVEGPVPVAAGVAVADLQNAAGDYTAPDVPALTAAASAAGSEGNGRAAAQLDWQNISLAEAGGNLTYPLAEFGYAGVFEDLGTAYQGALSGASAWWLLTFFESIVYANATVGPGGSAPLPSDLVNLDAEALAEVRYDGTSVLVGPNDGSDTDPNGAESGGETGAF